MQPLLLLGLLVGLCAYTALSSFIGLTTAEGQYTTTLLTKANYGGFVAVAACVLSYFVARQYLRRALGFTLLLSAFHLVNFLPISFDVGLGFGELRVGIEPFSVLTLIGYYFSNRTSAHAFIRKYFLPVPTPEKAAHLRREAIDQFKLNFARKSDESLRQLIHDPKLVAAAITAAQELLGERKAGRAQPLPKN
jgi:hypothetical protein